MKAIVLVAALLMCMVTMVNAGEEFYRSCIETHEDAFAYFSLKDFKFINDMQANGASMDVRIGAFALMKSEGRVIDTYKMRLRDVVVDGRFARGKLSDGTMVWTLSGTLRCK